VLHAIMVWFKDVAWIGRHNGWRDSGGMVKI
jgi:hypothetical protein